MDTDAPVRLRAFTFLEEQTRLYGDVLPRAVLERGFDHGGVRVPLVAPQGIFKPRVCALPLSITTAPPVEGRQRPYEDEIGQDGVIGYHYRGAERDRNHPDNAALRRCQRERVPLVYFLGIVRGQYLATWPVLITGDDRDSMRFTVEAEDPARIQLLMEGVHPDPEAPLRRRYVTTQVQRRVHQQAFRERVIRAYREACAVCRLHHRELLDAAHIVPDRDERGEPEVSNGLALCKLHHAAFDHNFLGVRPDYVIELRRDIIEEADGPMLRYGLQGFHGQPLIVPRREPLRPRPEFLEQRYALFRGSP